VRKNFYRRGFFGGAARKNFGQIQIFERHQIISKFFGASRRGKMFLTPLSPFDTALNVYGNTEIYQPDIGYGYALAVTGHSFFDGSLDVSGTITSDMIDVNQIVYSATPLDVSRDIVINGDMFINGSFTGGIIEVTDFKIISSGLNGYVMDISGDTLISGNLSVTGTLDAAAIDVSKITMAATALDVSRDVYIYGNLDLKKRSV
jgi:hypothetical protein